HDASSDVLPKPAGAEISVSGPRVPSFKRSIRRSRRTNGRGGGGITRSAAATDRNPWGLVGWDARSPAFRVRLHPRDSVRADARRVHHFLTRKSPHTFRVRLRHPATFDGDDRAVQPV